MFWLAAGALVTYDLSGCRLLFETSDRAVFEDDRGDEGSRGRRATREGKAAALRLLGLCFCRMPLRFNRQYYWERRLFRSVPREQP